MAHKLGHKLARSPTARTSKNKNDQRAVWDHLEGFLWGGLEVDGTQGWKVEDQQQGGEPHTQGVPHSARRGDPVSGPHVQKKTPHSTGPSQPNIGAEAKHTNPMAQQATLPQYRSGGATASGPHPPAVGSQWRVGRLGHSLQGCQMVRCALTLYASVGQTRMPRVLSPDAPHTSGLASPV